MIKIYDELGNRHFYDKSKPLGEGGQGAVYRTEDGDVAIKIEKGEVNEESLKRFKNKIKSLILKPLPQNLQISMPLITLKDKNGYVMKLLDDFKPLKDLMPNRLSIDADVGEIPHFLENVPKEETKKQIAYFCNTGGMRFRLEILVKIAAILARLHLRGFVYCDLSDNNVFYDENSVYFIDPDNIEYDEKNTGKVFTPGYEFDDDRNSIYSDVYAFGILAFWLLTIQNPLIEKEDKGWDSDEAVTIKEYVERDPLLTITPFKALFKQCFNKPKFSRPTALLWLKFLIKALNLAIKCPKCEMSYYDDLHDKCPFCDEKKPSRIWVKILKNESLKYHLVREFGKFKVPKYFFGDFSLFDFDDEICVIVVDDDKISVEFRIFVKNERDKSLQNIIESVEKLAVKPLVFYKDDLKIEIGCDL